MASQGSGWPPSVNQPPPHTASDPHSPMQQRSQPAYGASNSGPSQGPVQLSGPVSLPPPPPQGPYHNSPGAANSLPAIPGMGHSSSQHSIQNHHPYQRQSTPPMAQQPQVVHPSTQQSQGYGHSSGGHTVEANQNLRDQQMRDAENEERHLYQLEQRRVAEQQRSPSEAHAGTVPLRQPIASRIPATLHGPNGILSSNPDVGNIGSLGAPAGPPNSFPSSHDAQRNYIHQTQGITQQIPPPQVAAPQQVNGQVAVASGQQPILNDALTYLDQVKVRFQTQPDVYNKFLDIMKDFKSQAIDTPGVITRVSNLFSGHPHLIQGFNTFLPPGYKIEAGWGNDPNNIRVYTPLGQHEHNTAQMPLQGVGSTDVQMEQDTSPHQHAYSLHINQGGARQWPVSDQQLEEHEGRLTPNSRLRNQLYVQRQPGIQYQAQDEELNSAEAAAIAHQQEQRGVSSLSSAVNVAADSSDRLAAMQVSGSMGHNSLNQALNGAGGAMSAHQLSLEKRGPVEFNHAISYVNKIKNRFAQQPEIYKQFLEILQTYQRESKPIQDVYAQVTQLFGAAPDLLEDFKQFLPESAAQAKAQAAARQAAAEEPATSNMRGEPSYIAGIQPNQAQTTPRAEKMPPIGSFAPPSGTKGENKKRRAGAGVQAAVGSSSATVQEPSSSKNGMQGGNAAKRLKTNVSKPTVSDIPVQSPSLVPQLPHPIPPSTTSHGAMDEIGMFDKIKKFVSNRQTFNEFLKLSNLFAQELIDKNTLVSKVDVFLGGSPDLMNWFKNFVNYMGQDELIDNRPAPSDSRVNLSNCRALGPSYRMLPKRERTAKCSGRDEMCHQVLNDEWASHPTWASEDSGFIAHRKNQFEEALHRMEEERHDYDFNIETCLRTIQLLEPIVQQIVLLSPEEKGSYRLPPGLGGQSEAIWQRVIKKLYDRQNGQKIIEDMFKKPCKVCPFLLMRLKEKAEKWKQAQREWEKVWRDQTHKMFWKSLDHQGISAKTENKRSFQPKALQMDIQARYEEQQRQQKLNLSASVPKYQLDYDFGDMEVIEDSCHLLLTYLHNHGSQQGLNTNLTKISNFLKTFPPTFFGFNGDEFATKMADTYSDSPPADEDEEMAQGEEQNTAQRPRRNGQGRRDLRRGVLDPSKQGKELGNDDSKESTPDRMSMDEDSGNNDDSQSDQAAKNEAMSTRWMDHPSNDTRNRQDFQHDEPFHRQKYSLYANLNIYCFFRTFEMLYQRLRYIKENEDSVRASVKHAVAAKPAFDLGISAKSPADFFEDVSSSANYYKQIVRHCEAVITETSAAQTKMTQLEDNLRRFYMAHGWQLFNFDRMLAAVLKFASNMVNPEVKDRSNEIMNLFMANRKKAETTHQIEIEYRKQVEKLAKEGDLYRIVYDQTTQHATIAIFKKDDLTFDAEDQNRDFTWSYYVTAYTMRDWTEGVPHRINWPLSRRTLRQVDADEDDVANLLPECSEEGLNVRISPKNYHILWEKATSDRWYYGHKQRAPPTRGASPSREERKSKYEERFMKNNNWMAGMSLDDVNGKKGDFEKMKISDGGVSINGTQPKVEPEDQAMEEA